MTKTRLVGCQFVQVAGSARYAPVFAGRGCSADAIVDNFRYGVSVREIAEQFEIPSDVVEAILAYASLSRR